MKAVLFILRSLGVGGVLVLLLSSQAKSKNYIPYHNKCNAACALMSESKFAEAADSLQAAFQLVDQAFAKDLFNLSKCYAQLNEADSAMKYLFMALQQQDLKAELKSQRAIFKKVIDDDLWLSIRKTEYYQAPELEDWQKEVIAQLEDLKTLDQHYRLIYRDSIKVWHYDDMELRSIYRDSIVRNDSITHAALEKIILEYGWPGYHHLGNRKSFAGLILLHSNEAWFQKMDSVLIREIELGNLNPNSYASLADRIQLRKKLSPLYNAYSAFNEEESQRIIENCRKIGAALPKNRSCR